VSALEFALLHHCSPIRSAQLDWEDRICFGAPLDPAGGKLWSTWENTGHIILDQRYGSEIDGVRMRSASLVLAHVQQPP
jgi:hypothetical protein